MAEQRLTDAVGDALIAMLDWAWPRIQPKVDAVFERVADAVRPEPPMTIVTLSNETLTGLLVADRGQVLAFIGTRQPASVTHQRHPQYDDEPLWPRDARVDPYRRHP